jgi:hypothetical protein
VLNTVIASGNSGITISTELSAAIVATLGGEAMSPDLGHYTVARTTSSLEDNLDRLGGGVHEAVVPSWRCR